MARIPQFLTRTITAFVIVLLAGACEDASLPTAPTEDTAPLRGVIACRADVVAGALSCQGPTVDPASGVSLSVIVGGQGIYVQLASTNVSYASGVFGADVTVKNLIAQPMGTPDGTTVSGIRVFFHSGPTVTSSSGGTVEVSNYDGTGTFTASQPQPYFEYNTILQKDEVSSAKRWQWSVTPEVETFEFSVYVSTDIPVVTGDWEGVPTPAFGTVDFTVNDESNAIIHFQFNVDSYLCGSILVAGSAGFSNTWPIIDRQFNIDHVDSGNRFVFAGTFDARGEKASGTWGLTVPGSTCSGTWQGAPKAPLRIVFASNRTGDRELYIVGADGSGLVRLTHEFSDFTGAPAWSPVDARIAFHTAGAVAGTDIVLINSDGTGISPVTGGTAFERFPTWSPDGSKIAYWTDYHSAGPELEFSKADGSGRTLLYYLLTPVGGISWSPDGSLVAFSDLACLPTPTTCTSVRQRLFAAAADGGGALYTIPGSDHPSAYNFDPAFSPDGQKLAFTSDRDGNNEIYVLDSQGTLTRLTNHNASDSQPAWSPNGMRIAFVSDRDGNDDIYVMNADGTNPVNITNDPASDTRPSWSPW